MVIDSFFIEATKFNYAKLRPQLKAKEHLFSQKFEERTVAEELSKLDYFLYRLEDRFEIPIHAEYPNVEGQAFGIAGQKFNEDYCIFVNYESLDSLIENFSEKPGELAGTFGEGLLEMMLFLKKNSTESSKFRCIVLLLDFNFIMDWENLGCSSQLIAEIEEMKSKQEFI